METINREKEMVNTIEGIWYMHEVTRKGNVKGNI